MTTWEATLLGLVQGLTEFLPVSSSGHLVIAQSLLPGFSQPGVLFDALLHLGTLSAVVVYFWRDLWSMALSLFGKSNGDMSATASRHLLVLLIVGSVPTAAIGFGFKDLFESLFSQVTPVGFALLVTGTLLFVSEKVGRREKDLPLMTWLDAFVIGIVQGIAIIPGISRSGSTIAAGLARGLDPRMALQYSFLLSVPAVLGAVLLESRHLTVAVINGIPWEAYLAGTTAAAAVGYLSISVLLKILIRRRLIFFAVYCWIVGGAVLIWRLF